MRWLCCKPCIEGCGREGGGGMEGEFAESCHLLHGILDATVYEADHLHHSIHGFILEAAEKIEESLHLKKLPHTKLYATLDIGTARVARTREREFHPTNPKWNESFRIYCAHSSPSITISIKNQLPVGAKVLGRARIHTSELLSNKQVDGWFDLFNEEGHRLGNAKVRILLKFSEVASDDCWDIGIRLPQFSGIPNAYFPQRMGCNVTLYQNSHLSNHFRPRIPLSDGKFYSPPRLWEELYVSISEAKHFIYVAGWSVDVNITLVRDPDRVIKGAESVTVGELLKAKAEEGVTVLVMVWQDRTSISFLGNAGLMKTRDTETYKFFEGSKVKCFLCPRNADPSLTLVQHMEIGTEFTHHQKTVSLDSPLDNGSRKIVSFVGGIDLCGGRYDDENHTLFRNLDTIYLHDFQQNNFPHADLLHGGPREPWHDVHSKLEGPAAWDVLTNFEQRWMKQSPKELSHCLLMIRDIFPFPTSLESEDSWNVQVFRSIDDSSVVGFPSDPSEAAKMGLTNGKDLTIDQSIHAGYVEAIRRAKRFIYIENQYFFGSCFSWKEDQDSGCQNLIPIEIALKIASKIRKGERFAAYVVTPMWPEGIPEGDTVQAILHWNRLTIEMMYGIVAKAIQEAGLAGKAHPCDYLNFFCLGNREVEYPGEYIPPDTPENGTNYWSAQVNRRFLIYVHAKLMIVDDEYVIIGSANLNERSLSGDRDTEIAIGAYQPAHLNVLREPPRGIIHGYRMSLWYEHFMSHRKDSSDIFVMPESLECVQTTRNAAQSLWEEFIGEEVIDLPGHLLPFPIKVTEYGELSELTVDGFYPDTKAPIKGKKSEILPPILTT